MAESDVRVFRPNSEPVIGCLFLSVFGLVGLGIGAYALVAKQPAVRLDSMLPTVIGIAAISLAFRMYYTAKYQKIEATERGIVIYSYRNRPSLDVNWGDVSEYYRKPGVGPDGLGNPKPISNIVRPRWWIRVNERKIQLPVLEKHAEFQRLIFSHLPDEAIPTKYRSPAPSSEPIPLKPITQFSLVVDRDGLSVNSAVSKANIRWKDLIYVEEVFVEDGEGNGAHYMILISATDSFELTTTWDQFSEIRRCVLANAPEGAIVVL